MNTDEHGSPRRKKVYLRAVVQIAAGLLALGILWWAGGRRWIEGVIRRETTDWATFTVPPNALPIDARITAENGIITVCNTSGTRWGKGLLQISHGRFRGEYPFEGNDLGLLADLQEVGPGGCVKIRIEQFASPTWKRLPAPKSLEPTQIDLLVKLNATTGYSSKKLGSP